jgi:hypothetical protein
MRFIKDDGWNTEAFEDFGVIDALEGAARLLYEIRNCQRSMKLDDMIYELGELGNTLLDTAKDIEDAVERTRRPKS